MSEARKKADWLVVAAVVLAVVLVLGLYIGGYFSRSTATGYGQSSMRFFPTHLETVIYEPAAFVESFFVGHRVTLLSFDSPKDTGRTMTP